MPFTELTNRDAWGTIRGFVYQLDTTLLRWIALLGNQVLELERGEDIDIVTRDITTQQELRELEQVKYRENNVSLNQDLVLDMLFNFFQQIENNPGQELLFRYVTNAAYIVERPALFAKALKGIDVWQALAQEPAVAGNDARLVKIQQHLQSKIQSRVQALPVPDQAAAGTLLRAAWLAFEACVGDQDKLINFIRRVEWSTRQPDYMAVGRTVEAALLSAQLATDAAIARTLYARLFMHVAKLLSESGLKQLTPAGLQEQAQLPTLTEPDQRLLQVVEGLLGELEGRISALELVTTQTNTQLVQMLGRMDQLSQSDTVFNYRLDNLTDEPPPLVQYGTQRVQKVAHIEQLHELAPWVHLHGVHGSGKSQLAVLVAREHQPVHWLELQAYADSTEKATLLLESFLAQITQHPILASRQNWLRGVAASLPAQSLLVFNDLPRIEPGSALETTLVALAGQLATAGVRLLTTSNFSIPPAMQQRLGTAVLLEYADLKFTEDEIRECLTNRGAGSEAVALAGVVGTVTHYNPTLVSALLYQLQDVSWGADDQVLLQALLDQQFLASPQDEAQRVITQQLTDSAARELLYRLSLLKWGFTYTQVQAVSGVTVALDHPNEAWQRILHLWVQPTGRVFYVSPVVHDLGVRNLSAPTVRQVHLAVAESILAGGRLDLLDAVWCFQSFYKGGNHSKAGSLLLNLFQSAETAAQARLLRLSNLLRYATESDLPAAMPHQLRALIRYEQIRLHQLLGLDATPYQQWLGRYADVVDVALGERVILRLLKVLNASEWSFPEFEHDMRFILHNQVALTELQADNAPSIHFGDLFWLPIRSIHSADEAAQWCALADELQEQTGLVVWQESIAQLAVTLVARQVAASITDATASAANLQWLANYFQQRQLVVLWAVVESLRILLRFQQTDIRPALLADTAANAEALTTTEAQYLLYFALGKACYDAGMKDDAAAWLVQAVALPCDQQDSFIEALVYAAAATSLRDPDLALRLIQRAEELAAANDAFSEIEYIQVLAEVALAYWLRQEAKESFKQFEKVVDQLLDSQTDQPTASWTRLYVLLRHALGYLAPTAARERPPQRVADGSDYMPPYQGFFSFGTKDLSDLFTANPAPHILFYSMALFADGVGELQRAYVWSQRAFDAARQASDDQPLLMIAMLCGQYALATGHYTEALEAQLLGAAMTEYIQQKGLPKEQVMATLDLEELNDQRPGPIWQVAEETALKLTILPMLTQVLTAQKANDEEAATLTREAQRAIGEHLPHAADQHLWSRVVAASTEVLTGNSTSQHLLQQASVANQTGQQDIQIIHLLGAIARSTNRQMQVEQLLNLLPYLTKVQQVQPVINKAILVPFAKWFSKEIVKAEFVGTRVEIEQLLHQMEAIDSAEPHAVQRILQPAVEAVGVRVPPPRDAWLYHFQTI